MTDISEWTYEEQLEAAKTRVAALILEEGLPDLDTQQPASMIDAVLERMFGFPTPPEVDSLALHSDLEEYIESKVQEENGMVILNTYLDMHDLRSLANVHSRFEAVADKEEHRPTQAAMEDFLAALRDYMSPGE